MVLEVTVKGKGDSRETAIVETVDAAIVDGRRWYLDHHGYAVTYAGGTSLAMHRMILGMVPGDGMECDHINGDRLDNRRSNLRACTRAENQQNRGPHPFGSSRYRGVYWCKQRRKWVAQGCVAQKRYGLGRFDSEEEAAGVARRFREAHMPFTQEERSVRAAA